MSKSCFVLHINYSIFLPAANNHRVKYWIRSLVLVRKSNAFPHQSLIASKKSCLFIFPHAVLRDYHSSSYSIWDFSLGHLSYSSLAKSRPLYAANGQLWGKQTGAHGQLWMRNLANDARQPVTASLLYVSREEQTRKRVQEKKKQSRGRREKRAGERFSALSLHSLRPFLMEEEWKLRERSAPVCASQGGRGEKRRRNRKDEGSRFFFPSLFPGLFTKFLGSCLISCSRKLGAIFWSAQSQKPYRNKKICSASSYQKYFAAWT